MNQKGSSPPAARVLIVEDEEQKFNDISEVLTGTMPDIRPVRSATARDAERQFLLRRPDLLILDISMGIAESTGPARGGFANLGGMDILERLYLTGVSSPTIILTGFDLFKSSRSRSSDYELIGLEEIRELAERKLGEQFIDCIRYDGPEWRSKLETALKRWAGP